MKHDGILAAARADQLQIQSADHRVFSVAAELHALQKLAYQQEAEWLRLAEHDFPPLQRTIDEIQKSPEQFTVAMERGHVIGAIGLEPPSAATWSGVKLSSAHIASLAVHPSWQRRGIGSRLVEAAIASCGAAEPITVSTALGNRAAISLYQRLGFVERTRRMVPCGAHELELVLLQRDAAVIVR